MPDAADDPSSTLVVCKLITTCLSLAKCQYCPRYRKITLYGLIRRQLKAHLFREAWTLWRSVTLISGVLEEHLLTHLLT